MFAVAAIASVFALATTFATAQTIPAAPTTPANASDIAFLEAAYNASGFDTPIGNSLAFNIPLQAVAELGIYYNGTMAMNTTVVDGQALTAAQVADKPDIFVYPMAGANLTSGANYTLMLADASALGNPDAQGDYRHYLANNVQAPSDFNQSQITFVPTDGNIITSYLGPGPLAGTGAHRYAWLMFEQPSTFAAPANLSTSGTAPGHWNVQSYVQESGLGALIAAAFFTVENGAPTASVIATTAVNTATLSIPSSTMATAGVAAAGKTAKTGAASSSFTLRLGTTAAALLFAGIVTALA